MILQRTNVEGLVGKHEKNHVSEVRVAKSQIVCDGHAKRILLARGTFDVCIRFAQCESHFGCLRFRNSRPIGPSIENPFPLVAIHLHRYVPRAQGVELACVAVFFPKLDSLRSDIRQRFIERPRILNISAINIIKGNQTEYLAQRESGITVTTEA